MIKDEKKISIIVPVYNTPIDDFKRCVDSILRQSDTNFNLVIVDDGSKQYIKDYLKTIDFKNLTIISTENMGVSYARNIGLDNVSTEYVAFCDSDDTYEENFVSNCHKYISEYGGPDLIIGNIRYIPNWPSQKNIIETKFISVRDEYLEIKKSFYEISNREYSFNINVGACSKLFKTEAIKNIRFKPGIAFGEDQLFVSNVLSSINTLLVVPDIFYNYYQNIYSATRNNLSESSFDEYSKFWDEYYKIILSEPKELRYYLPEYELRLLNGYINRTFIARCSATIGKITKSLKKALSHEMMKDMLSNIQPFSQYVSPLNSINAIFLKFKLYKLYILEKKLIYFLGLNKDKISLK